MSTRDRPLRLLLHEDRPLDVRYHRSHDGQDRSGLAACYGRSVRLHRLPKIAKGDLESREHAALAANEGLHEALCCRGRFDLIYERYSLWSHAAMEYAAASGTPGVLEVNAPLSLEKAKYASLAFASLAKRFERWICANAHKTVVVTTPLKNRMIDIGVPEDKLIVIPNGINPRFFNPEIDGSVIRQRYDLDGKIVIGFVGWM